MGNVPSSALRQPPPPGRRGQLIDSNMRSAPTTSRVRSRPFYFRSCKKANPSNSNSNPMINCLPDELLIEILLRLSDDEIHDSARLVCRRWCQLIHSDAFVREHFHRSSSGLLLMPFAGKGCCRTSPIFLTATTQGRVEATKFSCRTNLPILFSCNGLALCLREGDGCRKTPFIFNHATKSAFHLPRFPRTGQRQLINRSGGYRLSCRLSMAYAAASMAYKVVGAYLDLEAEEQCAILTVGVDNEWRHVEAVEGLSPEAKCIIMENTALLTQGFLHWVSETHVVSLNVETESFTLTPAPVVMFPRKRGKGYYPLSTGVGDCISVLISCGDWSWEVWEMKPETWEWRKVLPNLDLKAQKRKIQQCAPDKESSSLLLVGWVRYPEVVAFFNYAFNVIVYNLYTEEFESIKLRIPAIYHSAVQHRNSLVWSERC